MIKSKIDSMNTFQLEIQKQADHFEVSKCQFCLYNRLIFQQLERLKDAVIMKNQRIKDLQKFIQKISKMALFDQINTTNSNHNDSKTEEYGDEDEDEESKDERNVMKGRDYKFKQDEESSIKIQNSLQNMNKALNDSNEISFRSSSKKNAGQFSMKGTKESQSLHNPHQHENTYSQGEQLLLRLKEEQMRSVKIQIQKKFGMSSEKQHQDFSLFRDSQPPVQQRSRIRQYDSIKPLSEPQDEDPIGSVREMIDDNHNFEDHSPQRVSGKILTEDGNMSSHLNMNISMNWRQNLHQSTSMEISTKEEEKTSLEKIKSYFKVLT